MRSHFLHSVLGLTALSAALVACGDDGSGSGGGGGAGTEAAGPTTGANTTDTAVTGTGVVNSATGTQAGPVAVSSSSGGAECEGLSPFMDGFFTDPAVNSCVQGECCAELAACGDPEAGDMSCFNGDGQFDTSLPAASALNNCAYGSGCLGAVICDSGISFGDDPSEETLALTACLSENCCQEFTDCIAADETGDLCIDCLNGDAENFDVCTPANDCSIENCDQSVIFIPICDSGLGSGDPESALCADEFCCEEYTDCTDGGSDAQSCIDCLVEGEGALCDAAIACEELNCNTEVCDSGLNFGSIEFAQCLTGACCAEFTACAGDGSDEDIQACGDCYNEALETEEPGALCAGAFNCAIESCGGEGGGGTGGEGAGGDDTGAGGAGGAGGN